VWLEPQFWFFCAALPLESSRKSLDFRSCITSSALSPSFVYSLCQVATFRRARRGFSLPSSRTFPCLLPRLPASWVRCSTARRVRSCIFLVASVFLRLFYGTRHLGQGVHYVFLRFIAALLRSLFLNFITCDTCLFLILHHLPNPLTSFDSFLTKFPASFFLLLLPFYKYSVRKGDTKTCPAADRSLDRIPLNALISLTSLMNFFFVNHSAFTLAAVTVNKP